MLLFTLQAAPAAQSTVSPISGTVTDDGGLPIAGVTVRIFDPGGAMIASAITDNVGAYVIQPGVPSGTYYASTSNTAGYINQIYNAVPCVLSQCQAPHAQPGVAAIVIMAPTPATVDFSLTLGGRVSGRVLDEMTGAGIPGVRVKILDGTGELILSDGISDALGNYITSDGVPAGTFFAQTTDAGNYVNELYGGFVCVRFCSLTNGTSLTVNAQATTPNIDFSLKLGGHIAGNIKGSGAPILATATIEDSSANVLTYGGTDASGNYIGQDALPDGDYFVHAYNELGFINEVYDNLTCSPFCDVTAGTQVTVTAGATTSGIDFDLSPGGTLNVTVTDSAGLTLPNILVILEQAGFGLGYLTDSAGTVQFTGIAPGSYLVRTMNSPNHADELYNNIPCEYGWCDSTTGTPVAVAVGATTSISFSLDPAVPSGKIAGTVTANGVGISATISIYNSAGTFVIGTGTDVFGNYEQPDVPPGNYFAMAMGSGFVPELYNNIPCMSVCNITAGTPIVVTSNNTAFAHFALDPPPSSPVDADLALSIAAMPPGPVSLKSPLTYTVTVTNNGPAAATNVTIKDGASAVQNLGAIPSGGTSTFVFTALANYSGAYSVTRSVSADQPDPNQVNNAATSTVMVDPAPVFGHFGSAVIDGVMGAGEWANAACHNLHLNVPGGSVTPATLCAMNDQSNMYFALEFERTFLDPGNTFAIEIDNDHDGIMEDGDDVFLYNPNNFYDDFRTSANGCPVASMCGFFDIDHGGTNDGAGAISNDGQYTVYEMSHPLNSGDAGRDIAASIGDTVGFFAFVRMIGAGGAYPADFGDTDYPGWAIYATLNFVGESASQPVSPGTSVTTDTEGDGATPSDPIETTVVSGGGGTVAIEEGLVPGTGPGQGYSVLDQQVVITAPSAAPGSYFTILFRIDASLIVAPLTAMNIQLQKTDKSGVVTIIPDCGAVIVPPCLSRSVASDGDALLLVHTETASTWRFLAVATPAAPSIGDLLSQVTTLAVPDGTRRSLVAKLEAASSALQRGQMTACRNVLLAFQHEVHALKRSRRLSAADADDLIAAAEAVRASF